MNDVAGAGLKYREEYRNRVNIRIKGLAESFMGLSKGFVCEDMQAGGELDNQTENRIATAMWRKICVGCEGCGQCWEENAERTYEEMSRIMHSIAEGKITEENPGELMCIHTEELVSLLEEQVSDERRHMGFRNQLAAGRNAVAGQLREISRILEELCDDPGVVGDSRRLNERVVRRCLRAEGIRAKNIYLFTSSRRGFELHARLKSGGRRSISMKNVLSALSRAMGTGVAARADCGHAVTGEYRDFCFYEESRYKVLSGAKRLIKTGEEISGDNFSFLYPDNGNMLMLLSDGMGSGPDASRESTMVIEMLEKLLAAGFGEEGAIKLLNSVMVTRSESPVLSTVDVSVIDLYTGICSFIKLGAARTYLRRGESLECIGDNTLPLGVVSEPECKCCRCKMFDGDYIIMVSDGVTDCLGADDDYDKLGEIILSVNESSPQLMAEKIMEEVCRAATGPYTDDMTVLVSGIWKKS